VIKELLLRVLSFAALLGAVFAMTAMLAVGWLGTFTSWLGRTLQKISGYRSWKD